MNDPLQIQKGEKLILLFRKHWFVFFLQVGGICAVGILPFIGFAYFDHIGAVPEGLRAAHVFDFAGVFWLLIVWFSFASAWTKYYLELWAVTDRRVIRVEQSDFFDRDVTVWDVERILEASAHVGSFIETFLDYGTLEIQTAGSGNGHDRITGIPHPNRVREIIMAQASRVSSLEEANREKEQLLHDVSHEVKSYLTKDVVALASIAESAPNAAATPVRDLAERALHETRQGVAAVMHMLENPGSKPEAIKTVQKKFDLRSSLETLVQEFHPLAEQKGLTLVYEHGAEEILIAGDEVRLRDLVFRNLLDNSIKYTKEGSIQITAAKKGASALVEVTDTGVGISSDDMQRLFTDGGKGAHSRDINPESTGFGLASAKRAIELHGGTISAHSRGLGTGSTFTVTLPLAA